MQAVSQHEDLFLLPFHSVDWSHSLLPTYTIKTTSFPTSLQLLLGHNSLTLILEAPQSSKMPMSTKDPAGYNFKTWFRPATKSTFSVPRSAELILHYHLPPHPQFPWNVINSTAETMPVAARSATHHTVPVAARSATRHTVPVAARSATRHTVPVATWSATRHTVPVAAWSATRHTVPVATRHTVPVATRSATRHTVPVATRHTVPVATRHTVQTLMLSE